MKEMKASTGEKNVLKTMDKEQFQGNLTLENPMSVSIGLALPPD